MRQMEIKDRLQYFWDEITVNTQSYFAKLISILFLEVYFIKKLNQILKQQVNRL